jgi:hypothetical protein
MASVARVFTRLGGALYWGSASVTVSRGETPRSYYTYSTELISVNTVAVLN